MSRKSKDAEAPDSIIELDKKKILEELNSKGVYQDTGVIIKKWDDDIDESFITETNKNGSRFIGVLNGRLERHGYGINFYKSWGKYLGNFEQIVDIFFPYFTDPLYHNISNVPCTMHFN